MIPIKCNDTEIDPSDFEEYLKKLCLDHKENDGTLSFAFLIYDFTNPTVSKILKDLDYSRALNEISGHKLMVFYINGEKLVPEKESTKKDRKKSKPTNFLSEIPFYSSNFKEVNSILKYSFSIDAELELPSVLFFQTDGEAVIDNFLIHLKSDRIEDAFCELRDLIKTAVDSLSNVSEKNIENHQAIFNLLRDNIESTQFHKFFKKNILSKISFGTLFSMIKLIIGTAK
jgi:hypothetical protein